MPRKNYFLHAMRFYCDRITFTFEVIKPGGFKSHRAFSICPQRKELKMGNRIFVGNLPWTVTEEELQDLFAEAGEVVSVKVVTDRVTGQPKGFAFVEMASDAAAQKAIEALNGTVVKDRPLTVNEALPPKPRDNRGQGGGRGGFGGDRRPGRGGR